MAPALQVKKRCRWLLSFTQQALAPVRGGAADPFAGAEVDANALGWALAVVTSRAFRTRGPNQVCARLRLQGWLACHAMPCAVADASSSPAAHMSCCRHAALACPMLCFV
jgi:histone-lysine N-methyltransferase SETD3